MSRLFSSCFLCLFVASSSFAGVVTCSLDSIDFNVSNATDSVDIANVCFDEKKYNLAIKMYTKALQLDSLNYKAYVGRGLSYLNIRKLQNAIDDLTKSFRINPKYSKFNISKHINKKKYYLFYKDFYSGYGAFNEDYNFDYANIKTDVYEEAIKNSTKEIELNPNLIDAYYIRGVAFIYIGDYEKAIKDFNKIIELEPSLNSPYYLRMLAYSKENNMKNSETNYLREIKFRLKKYNKSYFYSLFDNGY